MDKNGFVLGGGKNLGQHQLVTCLWVARYVFRNSRWPSSGTFDNFLYILFYVAVVGGSLWLVYNREKDFCNHEAAWLYFSTYMEKWHKKKICQWCCSKLWEFSSNYIAWFSNSRPIFEKKVESIILNSTLIFILKLLQHKKYGSYG